MHGRPFRSLADFVSMAQWCVTHHTVAHDVYFCLSSQRTTGKVLPSGKALALRNAKNVLALKALWLDVDVKPDSATTGKGYPDTVTALEALNKFMADAKLPAYSALVFSGSGGLHVYWISDKPLSEPEWRPYAEGLEGLRIKHGFRADPGLTTDSVRILRVPGTYNYKHNPPKPAVLKYLAGADLNFEHALGHVKVTGPVSSPLTNAAAPLLFDPNLFPARNVTRDPGVESLADGVHVHDDTPLHYEALFKDGGCPHFQEAIRTGGKDYEQGLWMLDVLACTFLQDGPGVARLVGRGHPTYSAAETQAMYDRKATERAERGLGWPSCDAFERAGCKSCAACPLKGKINSPLFLAARASAPLHRITGPVSVSQEDLPLPPGYGVNEGGCICLLGEKVLAGGGTVPIAIQLFRTRIRDPHLFGGVSRGMSFETETDAGVWKRVEIKESNMGDDRKCITALWDFGVNVVPASEKHVREFMSSWFQHMLEHGKRIQSVPLGWVFEDVAAEIPVGFAYGGTVYRADGKDHQASALDKQLEQVYRVTGSPEPWRKAMQLIVEQNRFDLQCGVAASFAGPLLIATGLYSCIFHFFSDGSGAHKSTALRTGLAVWCNPQKGKEQLNATEKGILKKMGDVHNLPIYWDEVVDKPALQKAVAIVNQVTEGAEGSRLKTNRTLFEKSEWQTLVTIGANSSLWDEAVIYNRSTDAKVRRIFEAQVEKIAGHKRTSEVEYLINSLDHNHGHVGRVYAEYLGRNAKTIIATTQKIIADFEDAVKSRDEERYWVGVCGTLIAGATFANQLVGANFDINNIRNYLTANFLNLRERVQKHVPVGASSLSISNLFSQWIKGLGRNQMWITDRAGGRGRRPFSVIHSPEKEYTINIQWVRDARVMRFSQQKFLEFCREQTQSETTVLTALKKHWNATCDIPRQNLAAYCGHPNGPETVVEVPIPPDHEYAENLFYYTQMDQRPAYMQPSPTGLTGPVNAGATGSFAPAVQAAAATAAADLQVVLDGNK